MSAKRRILPTTTPSGVIRIVRAIASMKVSSERYKSESRIAVGYVNRMQILPVVYLEKGCKKHLRYYQMDRGAVPGENACELREPGLTFPGLSDGRGLVWKLELRLRDCVQDVINEKLYVRSLQVPLN